MYDEKEILKRLDMADAKAQKAKKKRAITMYMSFFILSFLILWIVLNESLLNTILASLFIGAVLMFLFSLCFAFLTSRANISFPEDEEVKYWEKQYNMLLERKQDVQ